MFGSVLNTLLISSTSVWWDRFFYDGGFFYYGGIRNMPYLFKGIGMETYTFFYKQGFFSTNAQCYLTFSCIELRMLLRCSLVHISTIILRHVLCSLCFSPYLELDLFMSYLCDLFFIFIMINYNLMFFSLFFRICPVIFGWQSGWRMWKIFK